MASPTTFCSAQGKRTLRGMREGSEGKDSEMRRMLGEDKGL